VAHLELHHSLLPVVAVPGYTLSTQAARAVLPSEVPFATAIRGISRAVLLIEGLRSGAPDLLAAVSPDDIHEGPRRAVHPAADDLMAAARRAGALHACWSGAGPSVLALVRFEQRPAVIEAFSELLDETGEVITPEVAFQGLL
jgi:homoserine kinase